MRERERENKRDHFVAFFVQFDMIVVSGYG